MAKNNSNVVLINPLVRSASSGQIKQPVLRPATGRRRGTTKIGREVANQIRAGGDDAETAKNLVNDIRSFIRGR